MKYSDFMKEIIKSFRRIYGFSPSMKNIELLESSSSMSGRTELYDWLAFRVNGIGYTYELGKDVERNKGYDCQQKGELYK